PQLRGRLLLIVGYTAFILLSSINSDGLLFRLPLIALNIYFIYIGLKIFHKLRVPQFSKKYIKGVVLFFIAFNGLSILLNIFGRLSLAKSIGLAGIIGLTHLIVLAIFVQIVINALELQFK